MNWTTVRKAIGMVLPTSPSEIPIIHHDLGGG